MKPLLVAALLCGVALPAAYAHAAAAPPAGERYMVHECIADNNGALGFDTVRGGDKWTLGFDTVRGGAEFWKTGGGEQDVRWGWYQTAPSGSLTAAIGDLKGPINLALISYGHGARLTWVQGKQSGTMDCPRASFNDTRPATWHDFEPPPVVASAPAPIYAPSAGMRLPITFGNSGAYIAVSIGTTAATMLVDTGATGMTVSESIANQLIASGQATSAPAETVGLAGGVKKEFRQVNISSVTVGGHVVTNVHAGVVPDGADMLLGLGVLAKVSGKFAINVANSTLDFD